MECVKVHENPNLIDKEWKADHFACILRKRGKTMQVFFSMGLGNRKKFKRGSFQDGRWPEGKPVNPKLDRVLDSLILDSDALEYTFSFWASNFGYSDDSIQAKKTYDICIELAIKLKNFLGSEAFEELKNCERL